MRRCPAAASAQQDAGLTLTPEEVAGKLLPEIPDRYRTMVATAAFTGLRWGECAGLCWEAVDLGARRLRGRPGPGRGVRADRRQAVLEVASWPAIEPVDEAEDPSEEGP